MARVTELTLTPEHVKAARMLLGWTSANLAERSSVSARTIRGFEAGEVVRATSRAAILTALEAAGVKLRTGVEIGVSIPSQRDAV